MTTNPKLYEAFEEEAKDISIEELMQEMMGALDNEAPDIDDLEWPDPCDGDEDDDPMYDSSRSYIGSSRSFQAPSR